MAPVLLYFESFSKDLTFAGSPLYSPESIILQTQGARAAKNVWNLSYRLRYNSVHVIFMIFNLDPHNLVE